MVLFHLINFTHFDHQYHVLIIGRLSMVYTCVGALLILEVKLFDLKLKFFWGFRFRINVGGVTGMPGFNAATIMLQDWGRKILS